MHYCFSDHCSGWRFCFFIFHKFIHVVFPSGGWSSCSPSSLRKKDESWIPLDSFSGPSFLALCRNSETLVAISVSSVSRPLLSCCMSASFISFFRAFFCIQSSLLNRLLGLLCCLQQHRTKYSCLCRIHRVCCLLLGYPRLFRRRECSCPNYSAYSPLCLDDESALSARELCSANRPTCPPKCGSQGLPLCEGKSREGACCGGGRGGKSGNNDGA